MLPLSPSPSGITDESSSLQSKFRVEVSRGLWSQHESGVSVPTPGLGSGCSVLVLPAAQGDCFSSLCSWRDPNPTSLGRCHRHSEGPSAGGEAEAGFPDHLQGEGCRVWGCPSRDRQDGPSDAHAAGWGHVTGPDGEWQCTIFEWSVYWGSFPEPSWRWRPHQPGARVPETPAILHGHVGTRDNPLLFRHGRGGWFVTQRCLVYPDRYTGQLCRPRSLTLWAVVMAKPTLSCSCTLRPMAL